MAIAVCASGIIPLPSLNLPALRTIGAALLFVGQSAAMAGSLWVVLALPGFLEPAHHVPARVLAAR